LEKLCGLNQGLRTDRASFFENLWQTMLKLVSLYRDDCPAANIVGVQCRSESRSGNQLELS